jgi:phage repressor protein C with HTH and peptisase S24 domain
MGYGKEIGTWPAIPTQAKMKDCFVVKACGDSMAPRYRQGEPAYAIRNMPAAEGQDCIVELKNGEGYLKIFKERTAHEIICIQLNPKKECRYKIEEVNAVHAVVR